MIIHPHRCSLMLSLTVPLIHLLLRFYLLPDCTTNRRLLPLACINHCQSSISQHHLHLFLYLSLANLPCTMPSFCRRLSSLLPLFNRMARLLSTNTSVSFFVSPPTASLLLANINVPFSPLTPISQTLCLMINLYLFLKEYKK